MCKLWHALSLLNRKMSRYKIVEPLKFQQFLHSKLLYPHHPKNKKKQKTQKNSVSLELRYKKRVCFAALWSVSANLHGAREGIVSRCEAFRG